MTSLIKNYQKMEQEAEQEHKFSVQGKSSEVQPPHLDMATQVADEVVNRFSAEQQHEFVRSLKHHINTHYEREVHKATDALETLKKCHIVFQDGHLRDNIEKQ